MHHTPSTASYSCCRLLQSENGGGLCGGARKQDPAVPEVGVLCLCVSAVHFSAAGMVGQLQPVAVPQANTQFGHPCIHTLTYITIHTTTYTHAHMHLTPQRHRALQGPVVPPCWLHGAGGEHSRWGGAGNIGGGKRSSTDTWAFCALGHTRHRAGKEAGVVGAMVVWQPLQVSCCRVAIGKVDPTFFVITNACL